MEALDWMDVPWEDLDFELAFVDPAAEDDMIVLPLHKKHVRLLFERLYLPAEARNMTLKVTFRVSDKSAKEKRAEEATKFALRTEVGEAADKRGVKLLRQGKTLQIMQGDPRFEEMAAKAEQIERERLARLSRPENF